jgi:hypothetical protein
VQVDPKLQKLTALIDQKRAEQSSLSGGRVGRPGNPRFAEAARRVQLARQGSDGRQTREIAGQNTRRTESASASTPGSSTTRTEKIREAGSNDRLTGVRPFGHLYNAATPAPARGASSPHLGRNFDSYA